ncbi:YCF48-related protein [uncultured Haliea sp.]|uniref:WD40/YVTN/BNR-like repeat-containing protein n=1 Tax=uncultured Haliea sp. TaxID=622616 RepID=UPI00268F6205
MCSAGAVKGLVRPFTWLLGLLVLALPAQAGEEFAFLPAVRMDDPQHAQLLDIALAGERLVAVGERGVIVLSDDHGASWQQAEVPVSATLTALHFPQPDVGWAVGHSGVILHTTDGGLSWSLQFDGRDANRQYLAWAESRVAALEDAVAANEDPEQQDALEYALDDAVFAVDDATEAIETGPADPFLDVLFLDASTGFAVGAYGMLYRTDNAGQDWQIAVDGVANPDRFHYYAMAAGADGRLYLSGEAGLLYYSADRGANWTRVEDLYDGSLFGAVVSEGTVYAFGLRGHVFASADEGVNWVELANDERSSLYGGVRLADGRALMVGSGGLVLAYDAGGNRQAWRHPSRASLSSAVQAGNGDIWLVGMKGLTALSEAKSL